MTEDDYKFLCSVTEYVRENPHVCAHVATFAQKGIDLNIERIQESRCNMEVALATALSRKYEGADEFIKQKITACGDNVSLEWKWFTVEDK